MNVIWYSPRSRLFLSVICVFAIVSCSLKLHLVKGYVKEAIQLDIKAVTDLNYYRGQAHSLHLMIYELDNPDAFRAMILNKESRSKIHENSWRDSSIKSTHELSIQPGGDRNITIDRVTDGRYLGIIAGYFDFKEISGQVKLFSIELFSETRIWNKPITKQLLINVSLGRSGMKN